jgi:hypothetical protein
MTVIVSTPSHAPGKVELLVATRTGAVLLGPDAAREVAARLLVEADKVDGIEAPSLDEALTGGGG